MLPEQEPRPTISDAINQLNGHYNAGALNTPQFLRDVYQIQALGHAEVPKVDKLLKLLGRARGEIVGPSVLGVLQEKHLSQDIEGMRRDVQALRMLGLDQVPQVSSLITLLNGIHHFDTVPPAPIVAEIVPGLGPVEQKAERMVTADVTPAQTEQAEGIIPGEKRAEVEAIVGQLREVLKTEQDYGRAVERMEELEARLSEALELGEDESYQALKEAKQEAGSLHMMNLEGILEQSLIEGRLDEAGSYLRKIFIGENGEAKTPPQLKQALEELLANPTDKMGNLNGILYSQLELEIVKATGAFCGMPSIAFISFEYKLTAEGSLEEIIEEFKNKYREDIAYYKQDSERRRKIGDYERELASKAGMEIFYDKAAPGGVRIRELTPGQIEQKKKLLAFADSQITYAEMQTDSSIWPEYFQNIAVRWNVSHNEDDHPFSFYEISNMFTRLPPEKVQIALDIFRHYLPRENYLEAEEYINNALIRKGEEPI